MPLPSLTKVSVIARWKSDDFLLVLRRSPQAFSVIQFHKAKCFFCVFAIVLSTGCSTSKPYRYGRENDSSIPYQSPISSVVDGRSNHPKLDAIEKNLYAPIDALRARLSKADLTQKTIAQRQEVATAQAISYLSQNDLSDVHIAWRDYDPSDQWKRLWNNDEIHPVWKYTDGSLRVIASTVLPERVFRLDRYNPHTKTLYLNSADPARAVYAAATAKDFLGHPFPGLYAISRYVPIVPAYQHGRIAQDAILYSHAQDDWELERRMYPTAYSRVGGSVLSEVYGIAPGTSGMPFFVGPVMSLTGRLFGRGVGKWQANKRQQQIEKSQSTSDPGSTTTNEPRMSSPVIAP
ncbi:MAG: hypothetical protein MUC83_13400 [Pirellula sp.]|jgi:hypothetical protein|nr:hypothetical protein [Pirellula sp.]